ncbi:MAG TPA: NUDIX domain-containing protein [Candidatus Paceibacterota bacterium]|nr:NUDIX domain-containing protein [Candidatus Paceibacterota bacterium]
MKERNKAVPAVYLILEKDGKILFGTRQNTGYMDGKSQVPAGHVELGEMPTEALVREAKEEVGIDIDRNALEFVHLSYRPKHDVTGDRVDIFFRVHAWKGKVTNMEPEKCSELSWVDPHELPENTVPHVKEAINCIYGKGVPFRELDGSWLKKNGVPISA